MRVPKFPIPHTIAAIAVFGVAAAGGLYAGMKYFKGPSNAPKFMSASARAYTAESNPDHIASRIIAIIATSAVSQQQVYQNMDRITAAVAQQATRFRNLANERRSGQITPQVFRAKLKEIAREVATSLGISLMGGDVHMSWGVNQGLFQSLARRKLK